MKWKNELIYSIYTTKYLELDKIKVKANHSDNIFYTVYSKDPHIDFDQSCMESVS